MPTLPFWRQLRWWLVAGFVSLATLPLAVVVGFTALQVREQTTTQIINQLDSVVELKHDQIRRWLQGGHTALAFALSQPVIVQATLLATDPNPEAPTAAALSAQLAAIINNADGYAEGGTPLFTELFIYNSDGVVIAASNPAEMGKVVSRQPFFEGSLLEPRTQVPYYTLSTGELTMVITRPVRGGNGQTVGALAGRLDMRTLGQIMIERTGLAESGETYLVSREHNYLLTPSRHAENEQNRAYHSQGIEAGLAGESGSGLYDDYRTPAVPVIGSYRWVPELEAALLAEVNQVEIDNQFSGTARFTILMTIGAALIAALAGYSAATDIARPITTLTAAAGRIAQGERSERARITTINEIGALGAAFNHMADELQATLDGLEQRIAERTHELAQANAEQERVLAELKASLSERDMLSATVRELSSPVLPLVDGILAMPLIGVIDTARAAQLQEALLGAIERHRARIVLIDVTGVPVIDSQVAQALLKAADATRLLGAEPVLVGIRPELAQTIVGLGLDLSGLVSQPDLQAGLRYALEWRGSKRATAPQSANVSPN